MPHGERLHTFSRHARFLGLRSVRRWPKARGTLGEYAVSPRSDLRSPASLSAATCTFTQQPFLNHAPITQPTLTHHPSCRIQERFRLNHPTSTILESTTSSCMALARPSTASAAASLPTPPATRRRSPSCWQWCHERCQGCVSCLVQQNDKYRGFCCLQNDKTV